MDHRPYFLAGDLISNAAIAVAAALASHALFSPEWSMWAAMLAAMALGMLVANLLCLLCLMRWFGAMEIMLPGMVTGMLAGMLVGMSRTMSDLDRLDHVLLSLVVALLTTAAVWTLDRQLRGEQLEPPAAAPAGGDGAHD